MQFVVLQAMGPIVTTAHVMPELVPAIQRSAGAGWIPGPRLHGARDEKDASVD
jgi:hypothetical protein